MTILESHLVIDWLYVEEIGNLASVSTRFRELTSWKDVFRMRWPVEFSQVDATSGPSRGMMDASLFSNISANSFWNAIEQSFLQSEGFVGAVKKSAAMQGKNMMACSRKRRKSISRTADPWRLACLLQEKGSKILRCRLCGRIDVCAVDARMMWEPWLRRTKEWVVPCACPTPVHRKCAEAHAKLIPSSSAWFFQSWDDAAAAGNDRRRTHRRLRSTANAEGRTDNRTQNADNPSVAVPVRCETCGERWHTAMRLPNVSELLRCALCDPLTHVRSASCLLWYFVVSNVVGALYWYLNYPNGVWGLGGDDDDSDTCAPSVPEMVTTTWTTRLGNWFGRLWLVYGATSGGWALSAFILQQVVLLHIFWSRRFETVVVTLWLRRGMYMEFYFRLYLYFVIAVVFVICSFTPFLQVFAPVVLSWARTCGLVCSIVSWANFLTYIVVANVVLYIFFKTNYRVVTVSEFGKKREGKVFLSRRPFDIDD